MKLYKKRVNRDVLKHSLGNRVIDQWTNGIIYQKRLLKVVGPTAPEYLQNWLDKC